MTLRFFLTASLMFSNSAIFAVSPLVVDDADTVERGRLQLNAGWQVSRTGSESLFSLPINPVLGLNSRGELGATFGYLWRSGSSDADGVADLFIATKWHLWQTPDEKFKISARFDLKVPTASEHNDLGTGNWDTGIVFIATREWGRTSFDWNIGYSANDLSNGVFGDDHWLLGQAVRQQLSDRWTAIAEIFAILPHSNAGGSANIHFNGGAQLSVRDNLLVSALIGSAAGHNSPDLTSYLGFSFVY
jgi:hypothetical protein